MPSPFPQGSADSETPEQRAERLNAIVAAMGPPSEAAETPAEKMARLDDVVSKMPPPEGYLPKESNLIRNVRAIGQGVSDIGSAGLAVPALGELALKSMGFDSPMDASEALRLNAEAEQNDTLVRDLSYQKPNRMERAIEGAIRSAPASLLTLPLGFGGGKAAVETAKQVAMRSALMAAPGAAVSAGQSIGQDLQDGRYSDLAVVGRALLQGALEAGGEAIPMGGRFGGEATLLRKILGAADRRGVGTAVRKALAEAPPEMLAQGLQEAVTGTAQSLGGDLTGVDPIAFDKLMENAGENALDSFLSGGIMGGGFQGASVAGAAVSDARDMMAERRALASFQPAPAGVPQEQPGRAPEAPDTRPDLGSMRSAMLSQFQPDPAQAGVAQPPQMEAPQLDAAPAPVDPGAYDPAATAAEAQRQASPDAQDFQKFLGEQKQTPEGYRQASEQTADLVEQPADEQGVRVGKSGIEGKGILAQGGATAGQPLATAFTGDGKRTPTGRYLNHSASPNSALFQNPDGRIVVIPKRDLQAGEEVTVDYRQASQVHQARSKAMQAGAAPATKGKKPAAPAQTAPKGDWQAFDQQETLGVPRAAMPQVETKDRPALMDWLKSQGVRSNTETVDPGTLKPTQAEFSPTKTKAAGQQMAADRAAGRPVRPILVSKDGYVIDGHHQWLAAKAAGEQVPVIRVDAPAAQALQTIRRFPKASQANGATNVRQAPASPSPKPAPAEKPTVDVGPGGVQRPAAGPVQQPVEREPARAENAAAESEPAPRDAVRAPDGTATVAPAEPAASPQGVAGDRTTIDVPGGQDMPATYEVRELDSLIASGDYSSGSVTKNGEYPAELQPRDYAPGNTEDVKVQSFAQGQKAGYYINTDPSAANGPPTVTANGTVLNGNGRTMSLQLAASRGDMGWYRRELDRTASVYGLKPESYQGMRQPVLVRVVKVEPTSDAAKRFARQGNVSSTQAQSPARTAASLGNLVDQGVLDTIDLEDENTTFSEAVNGSAGRDFRQALAAALPAQEVPRYLNEQTGGLTEAGKELVRDLLLTKQLPVELIERMREDRKAMLRSLEQAIPQLMRLEGVVPESRVNEHLTEALEWISRHPEVTLPTQLVDSVDASGKATQQDLTGREDGMSPEARMLAEWLLKTGQAGKSSKPGLVALIRTLENRSSPILGDTRSGGQIAADALGVPLAPGAEFGMKGEKQSPPRMSFRKDVDNSVETADLAKSLRNGMPAASAVTFIPDGPFGYRIESKGKPVVRVRVALPQDMERIGATAEEVNAWAEGNTIYLVPGGATAYSYNHELTHALVNLGVLTRAEVEKLANLAHKILPKPMRDEIKAKYADASPSLMTEEMAAHVIEAMAGKKVRPGVVDRVLAWLRDMAAMLKLTTQSDYGLAKDVASGRILDKRNVSAEIGNDEAKQSRRIDAPGQQSLFGEQPAAPVAEPKAKPEPKPEPSAVEKAVEKMADSMGKMMEQQATLFDLLAKAQAKPDVASTPAPGADTQAGGTDNAAGSDTGDGRAAGRPGGERSGDAGASGRGTGRGRGRAGGDAQRGNGADRAAGDADAGRSGAVRQGPGAAEAADVADPGVPRSGPFRFRSVEDAMPPRGAITRARTNLDALRAIRSIQAEGRQATAAEREAMARFSGWGSLKWIFDPKTATGDDASKAKLYADAMELLPEGSEERTLAIESTKNAHYTHPQVVADVWSMVKQGMGTFAGQPMRALEPSVGLGVFIGLEPDGVRGSLSWAAVEKEVGTASMFGAVYPEVATSNMGYQEWGGPDNAFDLAISNVPFGTLGIYDKRYQAELGKPEIHDYFFVKSMDKVRPGGLVAFITSTGTMDKSSEDIRRNLYEQGDLVHAVRFPADAHDTAGTSVVTDLLILRKRLPGEAKGDKTWLKSGTVKDPLGGDPIPLNNWFKAHPEFVLGRIERSGSLWGVRADGQKNPNVVKQDDYQAKLDAAIRAMPANIMSAPVKREAGDLIPAPAELKNHALIGKDGWVWQNQGGTLVKIKQGKENAERVGWMRALVANLRQVWSAEQAGSTGAAERAILNRTYDGGRAKFGALSEPDNARLFASDPDAPNLMALEEMKGDPDDENGMTYEKTAIFRKQVVRPPPVVGQAKNATEAVTASMGRVGRVDPSLVAEALGITEAAAVEQMRAEGSAFEAPSGGWEPAWSYLQGNVKAKLAEARDAAAKDPRFAANVKALEQVQPEPVGADRVSPTLGAPFVPASVMAAFAKGEIGGSIEVQKGADGRWLVRGFADVNGVAKWSVKGKYRAAGAGAVLDMALNRSRPDMDGKDQDGKRLPDPEGTQAAMEKAAEMRTRFIDWIRLPEQSIHLVATVQSYNDTVNVYRHSDPDTSWITFAGMIDKYRDDTVRRRSVARGLTEGRLLLDHEVGLGKSATMFAVAMEARRLGIARKPMIATINAVVPQLAREAMEAYPGKKILIQPTTWGDPGSPTGRDTFLSRLATQDYDVAIVSHETVTSIENDPELMRERHMERISEIRAAKAAAEASGGKSNARYVSSLADMLEKEKEKLTELHDHNLKKDHVSFSDIGTDMLIVDEAHAFKNLPFVTAQEGILGLGGASSKRAEDLLMKVRALHKLHGAERGIILATGTPVSNTMAEVYAFQHFLQPKALKAHGVNYFDDWCRAFGEPKQTQEVQPDGTRKMVTRFASWVNVHGLSRMLRDVTDVGLARDNQRVKDGLPKSAEKVVKVPLTKRQRQYREWIAQRMEAIKKRVGPAGKGDDIILTVIQDAKRSAIDMRLVAPGATEADGSKIPATADGVADLYKNGPKIDGKAPLQFIFQDVQSGIGKNEKERTAWGFNLNEALIAALVKRGVPRDRIAVVDGSLSKREVAMIKRQAATGRYAVLIGRTDTLGTGTNAQHYAIATWHLDVPDRPADIVQRDGRAVRSGNLHKDKGNVVTLHRVVTEGTMDEALWGRLNLKWGFIVGVKSAVATPSGATDMREVDLENMDPEMVAAIASGDQDLVRVIDLEAELGQLRRAKKAHASQGEYLLSSARQLRDTASSYETSAEQQGEWAKASEGKLPEKATLDDGTDSKALMEKLNDAVKERRYDRNHKPVVGTFAGLPVRVIDHAEMIEAMPDGGTKNFMAPEVEFAGNRSVYSSASSLLGKMRVRVKELPALAKADAAHAANLRAEADKAEQGAGQLGAWQKQAELDKLEAEYADLNARLKAKPKIPSTLDAEAAAMFNSGMGMRSARKAAEEAKKEARKEAKKEGKDAPKLSRRITAMTEEAVKTEQEIVNPIDPSLSPEAKAAELTRLTNENRSIVAGIVEKARQLGLTKGKDNVKDPANVVTKAVRPSILAKKPWHAVEHIRDSYRFKLPIQRMDQIPDLIKAMLDAGITPVKYDSEKLFGPKEWGWRFVGLDMRMPNGQLVESYMPFEKMDDKQVKGPNHHLFEKWRNLDQKTVMSTPEMASAFEDDVYASRATYDAAFNQALAESGITDEAAARAAFANVETRIESLMREYSFPKSAALPSGGSRFQVTPSSSDIMGSTAGVLESKNTTTASSASQASSMASPSTGDDSTPGGDAMSDIRTGEPKLSRRIGRRIDVDGTQRPAENADGKPIAQTDDAIRNFWRWFGDSQVVDKQGRPLVVYRGNRREGDEVEGTRRAAPSFAANPNIASVYATTNDAVWGINVGYKSGARVSPVYLDIKKPLVFNTVRITREGLVRAIPEASIQQIEAAFTNAFGNERTKGDTYELVDTEGMVELAATYGYDGIIHKDVFTAGKEYARKAGVEDEAAFGLGRGDTHMTYRPFAVEQIKSATGNSGAFDGGNPDIRMSKRIGRPDLANPGTTGPVRQMMDEVDEARNQAGEPEVKPDQEREDEAEARFAADPDGERRKLMDKYRKGEFTDDVETRIAHHLINRDGLRAITTRSGDEMLAATKIMAMYRANGSDMARAFRARMDRMASPEERVNLLTQAILTPPAEVLADVRTKYEAGKAQEAEAIMRKHAEEATKVLDILKAQGIDPQDVLLGDKLVDPVTMAKVLRTISTLRKSKFGDALLEYWINAILSGPYTHVVNTVGNTASAGWDLTVQRWAEVAVGMVTNTDGKARAGELLPMYKAMFRSLPKAARNFARSFQAEADVFQWEVQGVPAVGTTAGSKVEDRAAIKGVKGRLIRVPTRFLTAADSFFKTVIGQAQATAEAYRTGTDRGLTGTALDAHMASELADYGSRTWHNALGFAQELTFQKDDSGILKGIQRLRAYETIGGIKPFAFVLPFTRTPWNIMATGVRKTPLGSVALAFRLGREGYRRAYDKDNAEGAYAGRDAVRHAAEQALAWAIMLALAAAVNDRDEKDRPLITGTGEGITGNRGKRELEQRQAPPLSIRIGDQWFSYARIEPAATALGMMVDMLEFGGSTDPMVLAKTGSVLMEQVRNKTFLQGISDLMNALEDPERFGSRYTANFVASWMPNLVRQPLRSTQEVMPEGKPLAENPGESPVGIWLRAVGRSMLPIEAIGPPPKIDVWGREIPRTAQQNTSWLARMSEALTMPLPRRQDRATDLDLIVKTYNEAFPEEAWWPTTPGAYYKINGKRVDMTADQYEAFLRERGKMAVQQLAGMRWSPDMKPTAFQIELIQKALRRATTIAKAKVLRDAGAQVDDQASR
jgi:N12 class adenine-specific DNA methylase